MSIFHRRPKPERIIGITVLADHQRPHPRDYPIGSTYRDFDGVEWKVTQHRECGRLGIHPNFADEFGTSAPHVELWGHRA